jgi:hypothetical protein
MSDDEVVMTVDEFDMFLDELSIRQLQREAARAITTMEADNNSIHKFNKKAHHNSHMWYKAVIKHYVYEHGGMPSEIGPGTEVRFVLND